MCVNLANKLLNQKKIGLEYDNDFLEVKYGVITSFIIGLYVRPNKTRQLVPT